MNYEQQILEVFTQVGDKGISIHLLSKHVYNMNVSLFSTLDIEEIKTYVRNYVARNSKSSTSLLEKTDRWGYYRLNTRKNTTARQVVQSFRCPQEPFQEEPAPEERQPDLSLDLFA